MRNAYERLADMASSKAAIPSGQIQNNEIFEFISELARELSIMATLNGDAFLGGLLDIAAQKADSSARNET